MFWFGYQVATQLLPMNSTGASALPLHCFRPLPSRFAVSQNRAGHTACRRIHAEDNGQLAGRRRGDDNSTHDRDGGNNGVNTTSYRNTMCRSIPTKYTRADGSSGGDSGICTGRNSAPTKVQQQECILHRGRPRSSFLCICCRLFLLQKGCRGCRLLQTLVCRSVGLSVGRLLAARLSRGSPSLLLRPAAVLRAVALLLVQALQLLVSVFALLARVLCCYSQSTSRVYLQHWNSLPTQAM